MRKVFILLLVVGWAVPLWAAEETSLKTRVTSLGLFKNGLAVVQRTAEIAGAGVYRIEDVPEPLHGTYWIESDAKISTRVTQRDIELPIGKVAPGNFQEDLAGREVVVHFSEQGLEPVSGTVMELDPPQGSAAWSRRYEQPSYPYYSSSIMSYNDNRALSAPSAGRFLLLKTKDGQAYLDQSKIAYLEAKGNAGLARRRKAVLLLNVSETKSKNSTITICYLAKGIAWAPSYRVDLSDPKMLVLKQSAVVKNELESFADAQVRLISGYPSVHFGHVVSPLAPKQTWSNFFQQLSTTNSPMSNIATQQVVMNNPRNSDNEFDLSAVPDGDGVDLHYRDIGRQTLDEGDALALETASAKAAYDRIVEWTMPDGHDSYGRNVSDYERKRDPEKFEEGVWDAVRFRNPLNFPMTTAPATFFSDGKFNGQQMSYWVNTGEETSIHVTKALSVRTKCSVQEIDAGKNLVINFHTYRNPTLECMLQANNHRNESITLVVRRRFSGDVISAEREPKQTQLEADVDSINKRNQFEWTITLKPGEEVQLRFRYKMMIWI
jgi:hypothetical protein